MNSTTLTRPAQRSVAHTALLVLGLFKLRIGVMIMITALVGLAVAPGPTLGFAQVIVLACTEVPLVLGAVTDGVPNLDATALLADATAQWAADRSSLLSSARPRAA